jgi:hypothetical protein
MNTSNKAMLPLTNNRGLLCMVLFILVMSGSETASGKNKQPVEGCAPMTLPNGLIVNRVQSGQVCADIARYSDRFGSALIRLFEDSRLVFESKDIVPCSQCILHRGEVVRGMDANDGEITVHLQYGHQIIREEHLTLAKIKNEWRLAFWDRSVYDPKTTDEWFEQIDLISYLASVQYRRNNPRNHYCERHPDDELHCEASEDGTSWHEVCIVEPENYALEVLSYVRISSLACYHLTPEEADFLLLTFPKDSPISMPPIPHYPGDRYRRTES